MVFRKSICNLSKYGKKNEELLSPVLNDYRVSDITNIFSMSLVSEGSRDIENPKEHHYKLRSNSFNRYNRYLSSQGNVVGSNTIRRSHSLSIDRKLRTSLTAVSELKNQRNNRTEKRHLDEVKHDLDNTEQKNFDLTDLNTVINSHQLNPVKTLITKDYLITPKITKIGLGNTVNGRAYSTNKPKMNKSELFKRLRIGAFAPLGLGVLEGKALNSLSLKENVREKTDLPRSKVLERLMDKVERLVNVKREKLAELHNKYADRRLGEVTLSMLFSGLKDVPAMVTETSELDPYKGIRFRGLTVDEMLSVLPGKNPDCPYTESVLWFLLTGEVPSPVDVDDLSYELYKRSVVPDHVYKVIDGFPRDTHPMTQYITAISALQTESVFREAYFDKTYHKDTCWKLALEDCLNLFAKNSVVVGYIYRRSFLDENTKPEDVQYNSSLDYAANLAHFLGNKTELFSDVMRLYLALHSDHEGGNVSAHASHLVGSALADPYFCFSSALCGLSGPLHGMANQECLVWIKKMLSDMGDKEVTVDEVKKYAEDTMAKKQVIPGYGHAVLKVTDPRHTAFVRFALKHFPDDPLVKLLDTCLKAIPEVLKASGKVRNPNPNVDCSTGVLLSHFNVDQPQIFTVLFGLSRSMGILSQLVWARALRYPIERPKSLSLETVEKLCNSPDS
ncbi:citrate synthase, mitochondrial precursor, putative [Theileria annulata]|uniref:Citrate synthase n=1 Tax=Theileria annulata TaxID=5874 RepID=Q4UF22_THEAN|nr:citrate synthase, mitochondrial precursor, putative [Theileria annulata]CAI74317.1 citrate synthase, mitochondrial precursor, putative [Theileria annulata]|eukprot:XP_952049.1 citrate synthase, mitochondrial precursor, putative [Theileria annulata]